MTIVVRHGLEVFRSCNAAFRWRDRKVKQNTVSSSFAYELRLFSKLSFNSNMTNEWE